MNLFHAYYVYRVRVENEQGGTDPRTGRFVEIRATAEEFNRRTQVSVDETVDALCWLALEKWKEPFRNTETKDVEVDLGLNLLSAAAYFNSIPLARCLLEEGKKPTNENDLFPSPMEISAWAGNADMLELFQESLPKFKKLTPRFEYDLKTWRGKTGPGSVRGATMRGDMKMLRLAMHPPSGTDSNDRFAGQPLGHVDPHSEQGSDLAAALLYCKTPKVYSYIRSFFDEPPVKINYLLARYANMGNLEMVRYLLDAGAQMQGVYNGNPLHFAAQYGHEDVVDLLIERGIDIDDSEYQARGTSLTVTAGSGCMSMVRKLINAGAKVDGFAELEQAIRLEHTEMANFFMDMYPSPPEAWRIHLRFAERMGLDSMAQLLRQRGVALWDDP